MFLLITFDTGKSAVIPIKWVEKMHLAECGNGGVNSDVIVRIFCSPDKTKIPNYNLPVADVFDENIDACYFVHPNQFFGESAHFSLFCFII